METKPEMQQELALQAQGIVGYRTELTVTEIGDVRRHGVRELTDKDKWCWRDARGSSEIVAYMLK